MQPINLTVTYQDPCHLAHGQKIRRQPRELLQAIPGLKLIEMDGSDRCCGSAGIYNLTHAGMSQQLLKEKMQAVGAANADAIVAPNPGCMLQLRFGAQRYGPNLPVYHLMDLLDRAYGECAGAIMKISTEQLAQRLSASLGSDAITAEESQLAEHAVDGAMPKLICTPATAEQVAAAVRICSEAQATLAPWGGGTAMSLGNPPRTLDVVVKSTRLNRVIDHDHANLTATVQSGITLNALQSALAPHKQFVPFDPPLPERSTVGGIVAANLNGPRRSSYGSVRDLVIGMKVVLASGETIKAGGKVVKNVAGYDMCKLFTGSLGTLGIISRSHLESGADPSSFGDGDRYRHTGERGTMCQSVDAHQTAADRGLSPQL